MPRNLYSIPPHAAFLESLAKGFIATYGEDQIAYTNAEILLPTQRACHAFKTLLSNVYPDRDLPKIYPASAPITSGLSCALPPPPLSQLQEQTLLTKWLRTQGYGHLSLSKQWHLAQSLLSWRRTLRLYDISSDALTSLSTENDASHSTTLQYQMMNAWHHIINQPNTQDEKSHTQTLLMLRLKAWQASSHNAPMIIAGITTPLPSTIDMMTALSSAPHGYVVFPGFDPTLATKYWPDIEQTHPWHSIKLLLNAINANAYDVKSWPHLELQCDEARTTLITKTMEPASITANWYQDAALPETSTRDMQILRANHIEDETMMITALLKNALTENNKRIALITHDTSLMQRVCLWLDHQHIPYEQSFGTPLSHTSSGQFFVLLAQAMTKESSASHVLALCKHPLLCAGSEKGVVFAAIGIIEKQIMRGSYAGKGFEGLFGTLKARSIPLPESLEKLYEIIAPLLSLLAKPTSPLSDILKTHINIAKHLTAAPNAETHPSEKTEEEIYLEQYLEQLLHTSSTLGTITANDYAHYIEHMLQEEHYYAKPSSKETRITILSPFEARLCAFDLTIIGGCMEGYFPGASAHDPWTSQAMRKHYPLLEPARTIGLAAHDFMMLSGSAKLILTWRLKDKGQSTRPSRWLQRLRSIAEIHQLSATLYATPAIISDAIAARYQTTTHRATPPKPNPEIDKRPSIISATDITLLMQDPYSFYAKHILKLRPLDPLAMQPNARDFGTRLHHILSLITNQYEKLPHQAENLLEHYDALIDPAQDIRIHHLWKPRLRRILTWFLETEEARRTHIKNIASEITGYLAFTYPERTITISAKADRIESTQNQTIIIDYKTGQVPTAYEINHGIEPQMPIEALITKHLGFQGFSANVTQLSFWKLSGGFPAGEIKTIATDEALSSLINATEEGLKNLLHHYLCTPSYFLCCPIPSHTPTYHAYAHLARVKAWRYLPIET